MLVQVLKEVPDNIFNNCLNELTKVRWEFVVDGRKTGVFKTSTSIHLRSHDTTACKERPNSIASFSSIVNCIDNLTAISKFPEHYNAALWIKEQVKGKELGRVMIVHLEPNGTIGIHADPGEYFERYSRYHIPLKTNLGVQFIDNNNIKEHMPYKTLCRLNNLSPHGLINDSNEERIHLIADVEVAGGNSIF
jgi:hypothetical protein